MSSSTSKFVLVGEYKHPPRHVEATAPFGRAALSLLDKMSLGAIGDLLAARGMRLSQPEIATLVEKARRFAVGDPAIRLDPRAEVAFQILSRLNVPSAARAKFIPLHATPGSPDQVTGVAYEAGLRALLQSVSHAEPGRGGIARLLPWLRQQALPVDHFLAIPVGGLRMMQTDAFGKMHPVLNRRATVGDLLNL